MKSPPPSWYTFLGGSGVDYAERIAPAPDGGYYITGHTYDVVSWPALAGSPTNTVTGTSPLIFVARLDSGGSLAYASYGPDDSVYRERNSHGLDIPSDGRGNVYSLKSGDPS
jgi:hypothetical protein